MAQGVEVTLLVTSSASRLSVAQKRYNWPRDGGQCPPCDIDLFDYDLPPHLIAQDPAPSATARVSGGAPRGPGTIEHHVFADLPELLDPGDLLVLNDTRVMPARLIGRRAATGGKWEGLFLRETPDGLWELMCQTRGRLARREKPSWSSPGRLAADAGAPDAGASLAGATAAAPARHVDLLARYGQMPLPPYIRKGRADDADDASAIRRCTPSSRAPSRRRRRDCTSRRESSTRFDAARHRLGLRHPARRRRARSQPIQVEDVTQHQMHREWGELPAATAEAIAACRSRGGRVVAVGTTSVRVLETVAATGPLRPWSRRDGPVHLSALRVPRWSMPW